MDEALDGMLAIGPGAELIRGAVWFVTAPDPGYDRPALSTWLDCSSRGERPIG